MKKRLLTVLLCVAAALCLCFGLTACGEEPFVPTTPNTQTNPNDDGDTHTHSFVEYVSDGNATCTADGTETAHCSHAGCTETDTRTVTGSKLGHNFATYISDDNATCTEDGTETAHCSHAGCTETDTRTVTGSKLGHNFETYVSDGNATCTVDGTETAHCSHAGCTETDTRTVTGSKLGHSFETYVSNGDATCTEDGTETAHCSHAGCTETDTRTVKGSRLGHDTTFHASTVTCISAGTIDYWECTHCERKFADSTGNTELYTIESEPMAHQFTVENKCKWYDICGTEWEYTEGLYYYYNETTDSYAVRDPYLKGDIVIPYGYQGKFVTKITIYAYEECEGITSITIPGSVQTIEPGGLLIERNDLEHITVTEDNPNYKSENECLIEKKTNTLILGCKNSVIPNDVTAIGDNAFSNCGELTDISIPDSVISIGAGAFVGCIGLTKIVIPDSVISIGAGAFVGTAYFNDPSHWDSDGVLYIDNHLIKAKTTLSGDCTVRAGTKTIAARAFSENMDFPKGCPGLTSIIIPDSVVTIGVVAFGGCTGLKEVTIGRGVTEIGVGVFLLCSSLESITVDVNNSSYSSQGGILYNKEQTEIVHVPKAIKGEVKIPNGVTEISDDAFGGCDGLTNITIPASVTKICEDAFHSCVGLTDITIPASVAIIEWQAFKNCSGLNSITFNGEIAIGSFVFENCTNLTAVYISDLAAWCNSYFSLATPDLSNPLALAHHLYLDGQEVSDLTIPNGITEIKGGAFYGCTGLKRITIPDSVISIGVSAFEGTAYYNDPSHWDEDGVLYIGNHLIKAKTTLSGEYTVRAGTKTIAENAFVQCETLTEVTIPNSVVSIGSATFSRCVNLTKITIPNTVTVIGYEAFGNCGELIDIQFMGTVKEWQEICKGEYPYDTDMNWSWDSGTGDYTITCTDGTIDKEGNVTYFDD